MKRHSLNTACRLLSIIGTVSLLSGTFSSAWADVACTNASFSGSYAFSEQGTGVMPDGTPFSVAEIAIIKVDGMGNLTGTATSSYSGTIVKPELTGTYTINPDCSGQGQVTASKLYFPGRKKRLNPGKNQQR